MDDVMDMMYDGVEDQVKQMVDQNVAHQAHLADQEAKRDAQKAEEARLEEARQKALAEADRELLERPLEAITSEYGPGSNEWVATKTLESKQDKKRKALEAMTHEEREAEALSRREHGRKSREGKKNAQLRREAEQHAAEKKKKDEKRKGPLPDINDIDDDLLKFNRQHKELMLYPDKEEEVAEIATRIGLLEEQKILKEKEIAEAALKAGAGTVLGAAENGAAWVPARVWIPADLKFASIGTDWQHPDNPPGLRDALTEGTEQVRKLQAEGRGDSPQVAAILAQCDLYRAELKRRLCATKTFKADEKKKKKELAITAARRKAIDDPFNADRFLSTRDLNGWWKNYGQQLSLEKLNKNTKACYVGQIWTPDALEDALPAQVETEEM